MVRKKTCMKKVAKEMELTYKLMTSILWLRHQFRIVPANIYIIICLIFRHRNM